jgi:hypothetical protein
VSAEERTGVLVMSARTEEDDALRVRLRWTTGTIDPQHGEAVAASADEALEFARRWIAGLTA